MLSLVQLYRAANPYVTEQEFQRAVKRKFLQGISPELRRAIYVFCNDPHALIVSYQRLLEYTRTAKLNIIDSSNHVEEASSTVCSVNVDNTQGQSSSMSSASNELLQAISNLTVGLNEHVKLFAENQPTRQRNRDSYRPQYNSRDRSGFFGRGRGRGRATPRHFSSNPSQAHPKRCYNCNGENHIARFCTKN